MITKWQPMSTAPKDDVIFGFEAWSGSWEMKNNVEVIHWEDGRWKNFQDDIIRPCCWMPIEPLPFKKITCPTCAGDLYVDNDNPGAKCPTCSDAGGWLIHTETGEREEFIDV